MCKDLDLKQLVPQPTRGIYLLDLILKDAPDLCKVTVLPEITDHRVVSLDIEVAGSFSDAIPRAVWQMHKANLEQLRRDISTTNWQAFSRNRIQMV